MKITKNQQSEYTIVKIHKTMVKKLKMISLKKDVTLQTLVDLYLNFGIKNESNSKEKKNERNK